MKGKELKLLKKFERFLSSIPLDKYREELMPVKTVEQDLPKSLNPLPDIYNAYWIEDIKDFPNYDEFFENWWKKHLEPLDKFIRQYFWGCSIEFVYLGFKARLYRTLISVLTQFHFCYSWKAYCNLPIEVSADLDLKGIDALVRYNDEMIALQIKKETYRAEAREGGRFSTKRLNVNLLLEIPYSITSLEELAKKIEKAKKLETRENYKLLYLLVNNFQDRLENGFVIFKPNYPKAVEKLVDSYFTEGRTDKSYFGWKDVLRAINKSH